MCYIVTSLYSAVCDTCTCRFKINFLNAVIEMLAMATRRAICCMYIKGEQGFHVTETTFAHDILVSYCCMLGHVSEAYALDNSYHNRIFGCVCGVQYRLYGVG